MAVISSSLDALEAIRQRGRNYRREKRARRQIAKLVHPYKLHLGCGGVRFEGWVNIDLNTTSSIDVAWDITKRLPFENESCTFIYNEHLLEHLNVEQAQLFLADCYRLLVAG